MNEFIKALKNENNITMTENGATAYKTTNNACLDAFGALGAMRFSSDEDIINIFSKAFAEDHALAVKMLFYMRDIRGGQGARKVFRVIVKWLAEKSPVYVVNNLDNFLEYGRGDDIICLLDSSIKNHVINWAFEQLKEDWVAYKEGRSCSLLAKWMPSENTSSKETRRAARIFIEGFKWKPAYYRKMLSTLRNYLKVVERTMSAREWTNIEYGAVPAKAAINYADAFVRHDEEGYVQYLRDVANGDAKVNAKSLFPVDIVHQIMEKRYRVTIKDRILYNAMWQALPNYCEGHEETGICVVDTSGSMSGLPMEVAISLGMYCGDKCRGPFQGHFITFSSEPALQTISGSDIVDKVRNLERADWSMNTDLEKVFDLILRTGVQNHVSDEDMPKKLYIISDMQFDEARSDYGGWYGYHRPRAPFMQSMRKKYETAGYTMPIIVYWNVRQSNCGMFQSTFEGEQCCMVSGYSASLFKSIIEGTTYEEVTKINEKGEKVTTLKEVVDPMTVMLTTLGGERYAKVWVG